MIPRSHALRGNAARSCSASTVLFPRFLVPMLCVGTPLVLALPLLRLL
jgi:hypothetical protein